MNENETIINNTINLFKLSRRLDVGITVLATLLLIKKGWDRPRELIKVVGKCTSSAAITGYGDALVRHGLITRRNGAIGEDRRSVIFALTPEGEKIANEFASYLN